MAILWACLGQQSITELVLNYDCYYCGLDFISGNVRMSFAFQFLVFFFPHVDQLLSKLLLAISYNLVFLSVSPSSSYYS